MDDLQSLLQSIEHNPVKFATDGSVDKIHLPCLNIKDYGPVSLPLCDSQAYEIIDHFEKYSTDSPVEMKYAFKIKR